MLSQVQVKTQPN